MTFHSRHVLGFALGAAFLCSGTAHAHFILSSPAAAYEQSGLGDPQKAPPCGDDGSAVMTGMVTPYQAGDTVTITIDETVFHPGHYRIALALNDPSELPEPPPVTPADTPCGSAPIMDPPVFPVLADGVFVHTEAFGKPQSIDVTLPDVNCTNCTLQVIQFMSEHGLNNPGGCFYHHCATISIEGGAVEGSTGASGEEAGSSEDDGSTSATSVTTATSADGSGTDDDGSATGASATSSNTTVTATDGTGTDTGGDTLGSDEDDGGCSCASDRSQTGLAALLGLLGIVGLRRRR